MPIFFLLTPLQIFKLLQFLVSLLALGYLQALISYCKIQLQDCEIVLRDHKALDESRSDVTQIKLTHFQRDESQVDFTEVDTFIDAPSSGKQVSTKRQLNSATLMWFRVSLFNRIRKFWF